MRGEHAEILVVDDEKTLRQIVTRALSKLGHNCTMAQDGQEALELAKKTSYDLVVTDLKMPKLDGLTLIERLHANEPDLPIVIMTGYADVASARKALRLKVSDYLVKPFESLAEVQSAVQRALESNASRSPADALISELEEKKEAFEKREKELTQSLNRAELQLQAVSAQLDKSGEISNRQVEQIENIVSNMTNGILVTDLRGGVLSINQELRAQLQTPKMPGVGLSVDRLPGDSCLRDAIIASRMIPNLDSQLAMPIETSDAEGNAKNYDVRSVRLIDASGEAVGIVTTVQVGKAVRAGA